MCGFLSAFSRQSHMVSEAGSFEKIDDEKISWKSELFLK